MSKGVHVISRKIAAFAVCLAALAALYPERVAAQRAWTTDDFFSTDSLQDIRLTLNSKDWQSLKEKYTENTPYPANLQWQNIVIRGVGIRSRGHGSRNPFKPGLKVDINKYTPEQEFLGLKSFVLDNLAQDPSMLHERVAMKFFQRMSIPAPRVTHVRLYINNEYAGLYGLAESIDKDFLRRVFGKDAQGKVENDGYLFEYRYIENEEPFLFGYLGQDLTPYARRFEPRTHEHADPETLYRPIEQLFNAVDRDEGFEEGIAPYLELPVLMRHVAVESYLADWDGLLGSFGPNNFYLYRFEGRNLSRLIPWDKDYTFFDPFYQVDNFKLNELVQVAMRLSVPTDTFWQTLLEAADSADAQQFTEGGGGAPPMSWLEREIRVAVDQIRDAALADTAKTHPNDAFLRAADAMLYFAAVRSTYVRCSVFRAIDQSRVGPECRDF